MFLQTTLIIKEVHNKTLPAQSFIIKMTKLRSNLMKRYIVLYYAPLEVAERFASATPEEAMKGMKLWEEWFRKIGSALVDPGKPLGNAMRITKDGVTKSNSKIIGMTILQADSMDQVLDMVKDHHHLHWTDGLDETLADVKGDCEIVVLEEQAIPEMDASFQE
jgi:hypothetical protein